MREKTPSKPIHILTALFTTRIHKENKQILPYQPNLFNLIENFGQHNLLLYVSLSAWKTGEKLCKNKHGENCIAQVVCWYFVRLCGAAGVGCEVSEGKKTSKPIHILTALFTTRIHKENKQILPYQPTLLKTLANTSYYCSELFFFHILSPGLLEYIYIYTYMYIYIYIIIWCTYIVATCGGYSISMHTFP